MLHVSVPDVRRTHRFPGAPLAPCYWLRYCTLRCMPRRQPISPVPPASLTKLITAYSTFQAFGRDSLKLDQGMPVSLARWKPSSSIMFLQLCLPANVGQMIQDMVVSGNDIVVAWAEAVAGNTDEAGYCLDATRPCLTRWP